VVAPPLAQPNGGPPPGGIPPEQAREIVARLPSGPPTYARERFLALSPAAQQELLARALADTPPSGLVAPDGAPLGPSALMQPPPQGPPQGPVGPPSMGPGLPAADVPIPPAGGPGPMPRPARAPKPPTDPALRAQPRPKPPPAMPLDPLPDDPWGPGGPDYDTLCLLAKRQRERMKPRQEEWEKVRRLYQRDPEESRLKRTSREGAGVPAEPDYIRPQPALNLQRHVEQTALTRERLWLQFKPAARDQKTVDSAQHVEDWARTCLAYAAARWSQRGTTVGDPRQDIAYEDAGLLAMYGVWAGFVGLDLSNKERPRCYYEPVSPYELFPGRITTRQYTLTLGEFRAEYPDKAKRWWPLPKANERTTNPNAYPDEDRATVRLIGASDAYGMWHCIAVERGEHWPDSGPSLDPPADGDKWVKRERVDFGICPYQYIGLVGTPGGAIAGDRDTFEAHRFYGTLSQTGNAYRQQNDLIFWLKEGIKQAIKPAQNVFGDINTALPDQGLWPGAVNRYPENFRVERAGGDVAAAPATQAAFAVATADVQDAVPPILGGRGPAAQSGVAQHEQSEFAATLYVDPIRHTLTRVYQTICLAWCEIARRHGGEGGGAAALDALPYTVHKGEDVGSAATLKPSDIARNGFDRWSAEKIVVEYVETNENERMQRAQYAGFMVERDFWDRLAAMEHLRVENPAAMRRAVFRDKAIYLDPNMQKAMAGRALIEEDDPYLLAEWRYSREKEAGPPAAEKGLPSPTGPPDGVGPPGTAPLPGVAAPGGIPGIVGP
jgi:hypothetical protein